MEHPLRHSPLSGFQGNVVTHRANIRDFTSIDGDRPALRVLIVDDCRASRRAMTAMAMLSGAEVQESESLSEGLGLLACRAFDLVVTDIGLPDGSGSDMVAASRKLGVPVLAVSADEGADLAGADAFEPKPFTSVNGFRKAMRLAMMRGAGRVMTDSADALAENGPL